MKYKFFYRDKIKREQEGVGAFLGLMAYDTLQKCYNDLRFTKVNSLSDLLDYYNKTWQDKSNIVGGKRCLNLRL